MPFTLLIDPCPVNFIEHTRAVAQMAIQSAEVMTELYGERLPVDMDVLISGGILRDAGKLVEYERRDDGTFIQTREGKLLRHPFTGMELAARCGLPAEVQHIIASHAGEGAKVERTTESIIVHHADFISFEAIKGLAKTKALSARMS
jgi:putative nucleotidyltransferase with HDIG domain